MTCQMLKNALAQLVTPSLSIAKLAMPLSGLREAYLRDVSYGAMGTCISICILLEEEHPQPPVFAGKVIRNFECIIEL